MKLRINWSYVLALAIACGIAWWMLHGEIVRGGRADAANATPPPAERVSADTEAPFAVRVRTFKARERNSVLTMRGRTEADTKVAVRAETGARVEEVLVGEGARVSPGDVLCRLDYGARRAKVLHAKAQLAQATMEYEASSELNKKGFAAETRVATLRAALDAAQATLEEAELELDRAIVRAPVAGTVQSPIVEVGEVLAAGDICASLINVDPMLFIGQVSERDIGLIQVGDKATVRTVTGDSVEGRIRYIAHAADPETRTFRIEIQMANADRRIRDGLTASATVPLEATRAHLMTPGLLVLDDSGRLGVRTVGEDAVVRFVPVEIIADTGADGVWVGGLPDEVRIITVGQDYVVAGQKVEPVPDKSVETAEAQQ